MKTQKDVIKRFREVINPSSVESGDGLVNLLEMIGNASPTPQASIRPTQQAQPQPEATMENVRASMDEPQGKLSVDYPYGGA